MPILARPIVQNSQSAVEVESHVFRRDIRNIVRLYALDNVPTLLCEWRSLEGTIIRTFLADGELQLVFIGGRVLSSLSNDSAIDTEIKGSPELIEHFAKLERDSINKLPPVDWVEPDAPCPIVIHAYANVVEVFCRSVIVPQLGDGFAVSLCSSDALPASLEFEKRHGGVANYISNG